MQSKRTAWSRKCWPCDARKLHFMFSRPPRSPLTPRKPAIPIFHRLLLVFPTPFCAILSLLLLSETTNCKLVATSSNLSEHCMVGRRGGACTEGSLTAVGLESHYEYAFAVWTLTDGQTDGRTDKTD